MNTSRKKRSAHSLINAAILGVSLAAALSLSLMFAGGISEMPAPNGTGGSPGTSALVSTATAAVPATEMLAAVAPPVVGADSRLDEFRLDPDSCCINHY